MRGKCLCGPAVVVRATAVVARFPIFPVLLYTEYERISVAQVLILY